VSGQFGLRGERRGLFAPCVQDRRLSFRTLRHWLSEEKGAATSSNKAMHQDGSSATPFRSVIVTLGEAYTHKRAVEHE